MKVLLINSFFTVGGPPRIVNGIYDTLIAEGHSCKIAASREKQYVPQDSIQIGNRFDVMINAALCRLFDDDGFHSKMATRKLIRQIEEYDPDIIHLHNLHGYYINIEILFDYLKKCGKKIFWTLHDCWAFTGHCPHFMVVDCKKWQTQCQHCPQKHVYPTSLFLDNSKNNFSRKKAAFTRVPNMTLITPSQWLANLARQSFLQEYPVEVQHNKIDTNIFKPTHSDFRQKFHLENQKIILGVAQHWTPNKGLSDFIQLAQMLDDNYTIVLVGLTPKQATSLPPHIIPVAPTNNVEELVKIYTAADVFVNPTYDDNFPTVNLEALACGTPVITYKTGGSPEALDNSCGAVVEVGNIKQVADTIHQSNFCATSCLRRAKVFDRQLHRLDFLDIYKH